MKKTKSLFFKDNNLSYTNTNKEYTLHLYRENKIAFIKIYKDFKFYSKIELGKEFYCQSFTVLKYKEELILCLGSMIVKINLITSEFKVKDLEISLRNIFEMEEGFIFNSAIYSKSYFFEKMQLGEEIKSERYYFRFSKEHTYSLERGSFLFNGKDEISLPYRLSDREYIRKVILKENDIHIIYSNNDYLYLRSEKEILRRVPLKRSKNDRIYSYDDNLKATWLNLKFFYKQLSNNDSDSGLFLFNGCKFYISGNILKSDSVILY